MPIIDQNELNKMTAGDSDLVADLAIMFVKQLPELEARIRIGIENGETAEVESGAHQLKSRVSYFGATELRQRVAEFELAAGNETPDALGKYHNEIFAEVDQLIEELRNLTQLALEMDAD